MKKIKGRKYSGRNRIDGIIVNPLNIKKMFKVARARLSQKTLLQLLWVINGGTERRVIVVPNKKRKKEIIEYAKSVNIDIEKYIIVAEPL